MTAAPHTDLIARINATSTPDQLAAILATITHLDRPGFPDNLPDGDYFDGLFIATHQAGRRIGITQIHHLAPYVLTLWGELDAQQQTDQADDDATAGEARRGRPEIGPRVPVRMPSWMIRLVDQYADRHGVTRAEAARALIAAGHRAVTTQTDATQLGRDLLQRYWDTYRAHTTRLATLDEASRWWKLSLKLPEVTAPIAASWARLGYTAETAEPLIRSGVTPAQVRAAQ